MEAINQIGYKLKIFACEKPSKNSNLCKYQAL